MYHGMMTAHIYNIWSLAYRTLSLVFVRHRNDLLYVLCSYNDPSYVFFIIVWYHFYLSKSSIRSSDLNVAIAKGTIEGIQSTYSWDTGRIQSGYREDTVRIQGGYSQDSVGVQGGYSGGGGGGGGVVVEVWWWWRSGGGGGGGGVSGGGVEVWRCWRWWWWWWWWWW